MLKNLKSIQRKLGLLVIVGLLGGSLLDPSATWGDAEEVPDPPTKRRMAGTFKVRKAEEDRFTENTLRIGYEVLEDISSGSLIFASSELNSLAVVAAPPKFQLFTHNSRVFRLRSSTGEVWEWINKRVWTKVRDTETLTGAPYSLHFVDGKDGGFYVIRINQHTGASWNLENPSEGLTWVKFDEPEEKRN